MNIVPAKTPSVVKKMFPNYVWDIETTDKVLYLTFDDGPTPEITNWTLQLLKQYKAKATFFCIGDNIEKHPQIFQDILSDGHSVGNHTHHHLNGWKTDLNVYVENVLKAQKTIDSKIVNQQSTIVNHTSKIKNLFRPPYGRLTPKQGKKLLELGYKIVMWDVLSFDWDNSVTTETCFNNVVSVAKNGSIVVFHDSIKATKNMQFTLPKILAYYSEREFEFRTLPI